MLDILTCVTLKPWFTRETLQTAEKILAEDTSRLLHYRNACALVIQGETGHCLVEFSLAPQIPQKFRLSTVECSLCHRLQKNGDYCAHAAVTAVLVMHEQEMSLFPAPLLFRGSTMQLVSEFLNDLGTSTPSISHEKNCHDYLLFRTDTFSVEIRDESRWQRLMGPLFPRYKFPGSCHASGQEADEIESAMDHLIWQCCSPTEKALNEMGKISLGQERARSLWTQLCCQLFMAHPVMEFQLLRGSDGLLTLLFGPENEPWLSLSPGREHLIRCLRQTSLMGLVSMTDPARSFSKIYFQEDESLVIEPWLAFADGNKSRRIDLHDCLYGPYCSLDGNVFCTIEEHEDDFSPKQKNQAMPLFAFVEKIDPASPVVIASQDVPAFLDRNLTAMLSGRHEPDPLVEEFRITDLPDSIEVLDYNEDDDWCYLSARYACGSRHLDIGEILSLRRAGKQHAVGKGEWLQLKNTPLDWLYDIGEERWQGAGKGGTLRLTKLEMMALTALVPELHLPEDTIKRQTLASRLANLTVTALATEDIPSHLRPYQGVGLSWLHHLYQNGIGAVLADEMGLGKTHQALALLELVLKTKGGPALVVCPASVLPHWQDKIATFYPNLDCQVYYGQNRTLDSLSSVDLLLTTYGVMRQDADLLAEHDFGVIIFDEIQYLKNHKNVTSKAALSLQSRVSFGLSGTPLENSLTDLKSIYDICLPGLLGENSDFKRTYVIPIEDDGDKDRLAVLHRLIGPFMLRRAKRTVLAELPDVIEDIRYCYLSPDQQTLYQQAIDHEGRELLAAANDMDNPFPHLSFLALVQQLKQICNHPSQLLKNDSYERYSSGKWELFKEIIKECLDAGMKVVVFSQYTSMLNIIEHYLRDQKIPYAGLRGNTPMHKRRQQVEDFNKNSELKVFCASLLAGGTGIDLTGAQAVIHYDRWWNAAKEEQATARVHRFGQQQAVQVFKFITTGTLEEKIHRLIGKKQDLAAGAIQNDDGSITKKLSREEIASILRWSPGGET